jgi:hypothetical protein
LPGLASNHNALHLYLLGRGNYRHAHHAQPQIRLLCGMVIQIIIRDVENKIKVNPKVSMTSIFLCKFFLYLISTLPTDTQK